MVCLVHGLIQNVVISWELWHVWNRDFNNVSSSWEILHIVNKEICVTWAWLSKSIVIPCVFWVCWSHDFKKSEHVCQQCEYFLGNTIHCEKGNLADTGVALEKQYNSSCMLIMLKSWYQKSENRWGTSTKIERHTDGGKPRHWKSQAPILSLSLPEPLWLRHWSGKILLTKLLIRISSS